MCDGRKQCQKPDNLNGEPGGCSPEQARKCHGAAKCHPCAPKADKQQT